MEPQPTPPPDLFDDPSPSPLDAEPDLEDRRIARRDDGGLATAVASSQTSELRMLVEIARGQERDTDHLLRAARRVGEMLARADRALYSFPAGGTRIEGPTVGLAEALGQEWRYLWTGVRIDRVEGETVYLTAVVFDALAGSFVSRPHVATLPPAPGKFASKPDQAARWESMQIQAAISKAIRTALLHALPAWYVAEAVEAARRYLREDVLKGVPLEASVSQAVAHFGRKGVTVAQLTRKLGADPALWTASDILDLRRLSERLKNGDATIQGEFGAPPPEAGNGKPTGARALNLGKPPPVAAPASSQSSSAPAAAPAPEPPAVEPAASPQSSPQSDGPDPAALKRRARELEAPFSDEQIRQHRAICRIDYQGDIRSSRLRAEAMADYVAYLESQQPASSQSSPVPSSLDDLP